MTSVCLILRRCISTTCVSHGKQNFRKFLLYNKRGNRAFKQARKDPNYDIPIDTRGVRATGHYKGQKWIDIPEKIPELVVPSLEGFNLKPYVTYRAIEPESEDEFTAQKLFDAVYAPKIKMDFLNNKLDPDGRSLEPSKEETMTPKEAQTLADKTGTDLFM